MTNSKFLPLACLGLLTFAGCSGMREANGTFTVHAESFRFFGLVIPGDDQAKATSLVPAGAQVISVHSTPADWTSVLGVLGNLFGFHSTQISGQKKG
jgi:hypothetical protein